MSEFENVYNPDVQRFLLSCLIEDPEVFVRCRTIIKDEYFDVELARAVRFILGHADENSNIPISPLIKAKTGIDIPKVSELGGVLDKPWFFEEIVRFCRHKALENVVLDGYELVQKGQHAEIERRIKEAMCISLMSDIGTLYFQDNPKTRLERMLDKSGMVATGFTALDDKLFGGFVRGGLNIFAGESGSGKSLILQNLALNWVLAGFTIVYFTLELSEDLSALRIDSMITGRSTKEVFRSIDDTADLIRIRGKHAGTFAVKKLPQGGTNANTLRACLKEFQIKTGIKPDGFVVDYLDLMYPNQKMDLSNLWVKDKFVSEELRDLWCETDCFGATASQLNRSAVQAQGEFDHSHVAGGISKINTSDNFITLYAPPHKKEKGEYDIILQKTRSSASVGQRLTLRYDPASMRITDQPGMMQTEGPTPINDIKEQLKREEPEQSSAPNWKERTEGLWAKTRDPSL